MRFPFSSCINFGHFYPSWNLSISSELSGCLKIVCNISQFLLCAYNICSADIYLIPDVDNLYLLSFFLISLAVSLSILLIFLLIKNPGFCLRGFLYWFIYFFYFIDFCLLFIIYPTYFGYN